MQTTTPQAAQNAPRRARRRHGGADQLIADFAASDVRLKEDIARIGTTAHGLPFYRFRYRGKSGVYEGVMAQEALRVMPQAVRRGEDGFLRVDYARLGVPFRRVQ